MVNMCDDAKISDVLHVLNTSFFRWAKVGVLSEDLAVFRLLPCHSDEELVPNFFGKESGIAYPV